MMRLLAHLGRVCEDVHPVKKQILSAFVFSECSVGKRRVGTHLRRQLVRCCRFRKTDPYFFVADV